MIRGEGDEALGAHRVARIEHRTAGLRAAHRQILERHLRGSVLSDRHTRVRAGELDVDVADCRHADEISRARQEARERRRKRNRAARRHPHRRADHHLLGDEILVETIGERLLEPVAERRILDVCVERHHTRVGFAELGDGRPVRLPRGHLLAHRVGGRGDRFRRHDGARCGLGLRNLARKVRCGAAVRDRHELLLELRDRTIELFALLEWLAVPAVLPLDKRDALALDGAGEDHRRLSLDLARLVERVENRRQVVAVDDDRVPAERAPAALELLHVMLPHRRPALAEPVDVGEAAEAVEPVHRRDVGRFPHRPFRRLAVAEQHVRAVCRLDPPGVQRGADRRANPLAERSGRHVDERQPRRRMPLEIGIEPTQLQEVRSMEGARFGPRGVKNRRGVPLGQHEPIAVGILRVFRVEPHLGEEQRGHDFRHREAARRMSAAGFRRRAGRVDPQPRGDVLQRRNERRAINGHKE